MNMKTLCIFIIGLSLTPLASSAQTAPAAAPGGFTDLYHVHFNKAGLGQSGALATYLKTPDTTAAMPGHFVVLRHQEGDDWDFCVIQHLGTKTTLDVAVATAPANASTQNRNLSSWHSDTFVLGPSWAEFARSMGIPAAAGSTPSNFIYVVSTWRAAPGHRDQLLQALKSNDPSTIPVGHVIMSHLEGAAWSLLSVDRYNSWQDFAAIEAAAMPKTGTGKDGWSAVREHGSFHTDTIADRIAPLP